MSARACGSMSKTGSQGSGRVCDRDAVLRGEALAIQNLERIARQPLRILTDDQIVARFWAGQRRGQLAPPAVAVKAVGYHHATTKHPLAKLVLLA
ncbi:hypothetical protein [Prauserella sp. PE36]|uniref:hypothetical protein n=1 Tax=Prauserella sp. PE36 TaxID=1504709 RepID=UPI0011BDD40B|nr:hypothetical protein [Prauserella sp. PE36]